MPKFNLHNEYERQQFKDYCDKLCKEAITMPLALVEVIKKHGQRSTSQNAYLHVCLGYYASEFGYTIEEVKHEIFKKKLNKDIFQVERINKRGQRVIRLRSSRDLDRKEMTTAIERFRNWSSAIAGLYIPAPNETEALFEAQRQIEQYQEFL